ncbi:MAG: DUF481 domain-containing protein [Elusimicrobiota bacterium]
MGTRKMIQATRISLALLLATPVTGFAQDAPEKRWKDTAEVSLVTTNGNSRATTTSAGNRFEYSWTRTTLGVNAGALGAKSEDRVTTERYNASEKVSFRFTDHNYVFERFGWERNRYAGFLHRWDFSSGLGRELLHMEKHSLISELGFGYTNEERVDAPRQHFASGRTYSKYTWQVSETATFSQDGEVLANFKDMDGYRLNTETALTASITVHFSIKTAFLWNRVGAPPPGVLKDDTTTSVALIANF